MQVGGCWHQGGAHAVRTPRGVLKVPHLHHPRAHSWLCQLHRWREHFEQPSNWAPLWRFYRLACPAGRRLGHRAAGHCPRGYLDPTCRHGVPLRSVYALAQASRALNLLLSFWRLQSLGDLHVSRLVLAGRGTKPADPSRLYALLGRFGAAVSI